MSFKVEKRKKAWNPEIRISGSNTGSVLIYIIVVMMVFALLGAAMVAMFSAATMMSTGTPNYARQARHLAESGMRYAVSELRTDYSPGVIQALNDTEYTLSGSGKFDLNVFGKWFEVSADYAGTGNIQLSVPEGQIVGDNLFSIPAGAYLVNLESYRDALFFGGGAAKESFVTQIDSAPVLAQGASSLEIAPTDSFLATASKNHRMLLSVKPSADQTIGAGGDLTVSYQNTDDWNFFPRENGSFYVVESGGVMNRYYYSNLDEVSSSVFSLTGLTGTEFPLAVSQASDLVILSERNHSIGATGSAGGGGGGGNLDIAADFQPNINDPQPIPPPAPGALPADLSPSDFASDDTATPGSDPGTVSVDTTTDGESVTLGGNVGAASSAAWYGGNATLGGFDVCTGGKCDFNLGVRAFFVFDYTGVGDGFTFTLASGSQNELTAYGGIGERMGYAGGSPGIARPKMALEFDTYTNSGRNDPGSGNKDYIQYVFWGDDPNSVDDDNIHDTGGAGEKWAPYSTVADVRTKPALNSDGSALYVNADGNLYGVNPDTGASLFASAPFNPYGVTSKSSPTLDSSGYIIMGESDSGIGYIDSIEPDGSGYNGGIGWEQTNGVVDSSPVIDSDGVVYFGTQNGFFYAIVDSNIPDNDGDFKWTYYSGGTYEIIGTPALSPDETAVYFVTKDPGYLYALSTASGNLKWKFFLNEKSESSPRVAEDGTIYVGSDDGNVYAVTDNGTNPSMKWQFPTGGKVKSRPALGPDGTIYVGRDGGSLFAITDHGDSASGKWEFPTGGHVKGSPMIHDDGTIWFGSDDNHLYVVDPKGRQIDRYDLGGSVKSSPSQGPDGSVYVGSDANFFYAFTPSCQPRNQETRYFTSDDLPADVTVSSNTDWLNSGPWAVRMEIIRGTTANARKKYEYTLKMWLRQCSDQTCSEDTSTPANDIAETYFSDTRIAYEAREPFLEQTIELCQTDHDDFDKFIFGYTQGTGSAVQAITLTETQLGFIRPGDFTITDDPDWQ